MREGNYLNYFIFFDYLTFKSNDFQHGKLQKYYCLFIYLLIIQKSKHLKNFFSNDNISSRISVSSFFPKITINISL